SVEARRNALWTGARCETQRARKLEWLALGDPDETVRQVAMHCISLWHDVDDRDVRQATVRMSWLLAGKSMHNRRAAAEGLGRLRARRFVPELLAALAGPSDRVLDHSLIFALIEIADRDATAKGLAHK